MREVSICVGCVFGLVVLLSLFGGVFSTSAREPAHAMEVAQLRADLSGARAEADRLKAELEKCQAELKSAKEAAEALKQKVAALEPRPQGSAKR